MSSNYWRFYKKGDEDWEPEYFASTVGERRKWYADHLEFKPKIDVKDELRALVEIYAQRGVTAVGELDYPERVALTAAYIGQIPEGEADDIVTDLRGIDLPKAIAKVMGEIASNLMFAIPNQPTDEKAAIKFTHLLMNEIVNYCADGVQDEFDIVVAAINAHNDENY